jgi:hypothetical protein
LEKLSFPSGLFTTEQVAWLKAKLPESTESQILAPYWTIEKPISMSGKNKNVFVVGKRKPFLDSKIDRKRIEKYALEFQKRVEWFRVNPLAAPEDYES